MGSYAYLAKRFTESTGANSCTQHTLSADDDRCFRRAGVAASIRVVEGARSVAGASTPSVEVPQDALTRSFGELAAVKLEFEIRRFVPREFACRAEHIAWQVADILDRQVDARQALTEIVLCSFGDADPWGHCGDAQESRGLLVTGFAKLFVRRIPHAHSIIDSAHFDCTKLRMVD